MTRVAWHLKKDELRQGHSPPSRKRKFVYNLSRAELSQGVERGVPEAGDRRAHPGVFHPHSAQGGSAEGAGVQAAHRADRQSVRNQLQPHGGRVSATAGAGERPGGSRWKIAISIPACPRGPPNTAWPTTRTPNWRVKLAEKDAGLDRPGDAADVLEFYRDRNCRSPPGRSPRSGKRRWPRSEKLRAPADRAISGR